ncbi:MAG: hypothetical protein M1838_002379 [Thelocarpon superellum]|nr:MAG: hypothetical protein M1838_002379 [Thelocarpon superellum]
MVEAAIDSSIWSPEQNATCAAGGGDVDDLPVAADQLVLFTPNLGQGHDGDELRRRDLRLPPGIGTPGGGLGQGGLGARVLAAKSYVLAKVAMSAGRVIVMTFRNGQLTLAHAAAGVIAARPQWYSTDHVMPLSLPYKFVHYVMADSPARQVLLSLLPKQQVTAFTDHIRDDTSINQACNLFLVPHWINEVMGYLIATNVAVDRRQFSPRARMLLQQYVQLIRKDYMTTAKVLAYTLAAAAGDQGVASDFLDYCTQRFQRAVLWLAQETGWLGVDNPLFFLDQHARTGIAGGIVGGLVNTWRVLPSVRPPRCVKGRCLGGTGGNDTSTSTNSSMANSTASVGSAAVDQYLHSFIEVGGYGAPGVAGALAAGQNTTNTTLPVLHPPVQYLPKVSDDWDPDDVDDPPPPGSTDAGDATVGNLTQSQLDQATKKVFLDARSLPRQLSAPARRRRRAVLIAGDVSSQSDL